MFNYKEYVKNLILKDFNKWRNNADFMEQLKHCLWANAYICDFVQEWGLGCLDNDILREDVELSTQEIKSRLEDNQELVKEYFNIKNFDIKAFLKEWGESLFTINDLLKRDVFFGALIELYREHRKDIEKVINEYVEIY